MPIRLGRSSAAWAAIVVLAATAQAQQPSPEQVSAIRSSCRSDFMANCSGVPRGGAEALTCLKQHLAQLSAPCQSAVSAIMPKPAAPPPAPVAAPAPPPAPVAPAPAAAAAPATPAVPAPSSPRPSDASAAPAPNSAAPPSLPKKKRAAAPTGAQPAAASAAAAAPPQAPPATPPAPQSASLGPIPPLPPRVRLMILRACGPEHQAYCANAPVGGGRIVDCLAANGASLSPQCRDAILSAK